MSAPLELHWSGVEVLKARRIAFRRLHMRMNESAPNSLLCQRLGLPTDAQRPQRLIHWARQQPEWGQA
jgi:hypothetical protein